MTSVTHTHKHPSGRSHLARTFVFVVLFLMLLRCVGINLSSAQSSSAMRDVERGRRIYRDGVLPSGKPLNAIVQSDSKVAGAQFNCASCHRRSGFGSSEGAAFVPPVSARALFDETELRRADFFRKLYQEVQPARFRARVRDPRVRPAYTDETLAAALREGVDPTGRALDPLMPRYALSDVEVRALVAYLKTLSAEPAPGVAKSEIHFATVVAEGSDPAERRAMLDVLDAYFRWKNADTALMLKRPGTSPYSRADFYGAYRRWVLHVWELKGAPQTWAEQLRRYYRAQPVFALLSGMGAGAWQPVHDFCERAEAPCLFPHTDLPTVSQTGAYTIYFSKGLTVEAEALARHLRDTAGAGDKRTRVVQVYRGDESGCVPARALRAALRADGRVRLSDRVLKESDKPTPRFFKSLLEDERPAILVLWLGQKDLEELNLTRESVAGVRRLYLSSSLLKEIPSSALDGVRDKVFLTHPYALPRDATPHIYRVRAWLDSRGVAGASERIRINTYFALYVADHALTQLAENFSRDYFIERVEHETESAPNPGVFPHLSLGPGQRFASKGSYVVSLSDLIGGGRRPVGEWIVP